MVTCNKCGYDGDFCSCTPGQQKNVSNNRRPVEKIQQLRNDFPGYPDESYQAAAFIGLDFPYVPGDPGI